MRRTSIGIASLVLALVAGACGSDVNGDDGGSAGDQNNGHSAGRTIEIEMQDIAYEPDRVTVEAGETVRFVFTNTGEVTHDAFLGDAAAQDDHEQEVIQHGGHGDDDSSAITVEPGETGELTHTFAAGDELLVGCHEPGHYDAGMRLTIDLT
jgi:uncharacterized cupredoxin-like copper-binding protein